MPALVGAVLAGMFLVYAGSYYHLSRRGLAEAPTYGLDDAFLYVPAHEVFATEDLSGHYFRCRIFAPLNWLDRHLFGGPHPIGGIMFRLS